MCQTTIFSCGHSVFRDCGLPKKPAGAQPKLEGQWWEAKKLPVPARNLVCGGIIPPVEVKVPCYKCVTDEQASLKKKNTVASQEKMRERRGAGNDNYMMSLSYGANYDKDGQFICNKPEGFVFLDMLGRKPWDKDEHLEKVGMMRDHQGRIVDRPDITAEQVDLQARSTVAIAERNTTLKPEELGSRNLAYAGMSSRAITSPKSPADATASASATASNGSDSPTTQEGDEYESPVTDYFDYAYGLNGELWVTSVPAAAN